MITLDVVPPDPVLNCPQSPQGAVIESNTDDVPLFPFTSTVVPIDAHPVPIVTVLAQGVIV